jgi:NAD(P)-dependent dehydrogenase (short-subunit alcohol dehydrogenase family)
MVSVLVTGASRGIGLEFTRQYAAEGARVFACARDPEKADDLKKLIGESGGKATLHRLDVTDLAQLAVLAHELQREAIDILINNAGIDGTMTRGVIDDEEWLEVFCVNTIAPYRIARALHGHMKKSPRPRIVSISSHLGSISQSSGYALDYGASKAALNYVMHALAVQWEMDGFTIVTMSPGWVQTDMGGAGAPLTPEESVGAMRDVIARLKPKDSGRFLGHRGEEIPW